MGFSTPYHRTMKPGEPCTNPTKELPTFLLLPLWSFTYLPTAQLARWLGSSGSSTKKGLGLSHSESNHLANNQSFFWKREHQITLTAQSERRAIYIQYDKFSVQWCSFIFYKTLYGFSECELCCDNHVNPPPKKTNYFLNLFGDFQLVVNAVFLSGFLMHSMDHILKVLWLIL